MTGSKMGTREWYHKLPRLCSPRDFSAFVPPGSKPIGFNADGAPIWSKEDRREAKTKQRASYCPEQISGEFPIGLDVNAQPIYIKDPYDEETAMDVCARIAAGDSLKEICADPEMPNQGVFYQWRADNKNLRDIYRVAREAQMDTWADDIVAISDDASGDYVDRVGKHGETERVVDPESTRRAQIRIDTRKWLMARLGSRTYGEKVDVAISGELNVSTLSDDELEARTLARLADLGVEVPSKLLLRPHTTAPEPLTIEHQPEDDEV